MQFYVQSDFETNMQLVPGLTNPCRLIIKKEFLLITSDSSFTKLPLKQSIIIVKPKNTKQRWILSLQFVNSVVNFFHFTVIGHCDVPENTLLPTPPSFKKFCVQDSLPPRIFRWPSRGGGRGYEWDEYFLALRILTNGSSSNMWVNPCFVLGKMIYVTTLPLFSHCVRQMVAICIHLVF